MITEYNLNRAQVTLVTIGPFLKQVVIENYDAWDKIVTLGSYVKDYIVPKHTNAILDLGAQIKEPFVLKVTTTECATFIPNLEVLEDER